MATRALPTHACSSKTKRSPKEASRVDTKLPRRTWNAIFPASVLLGFEKVAFAVGEGDWSSPGLASGDESTYGPRFVKQEGGLLVQDLLEGKGDEASVGDRIIFDYVCRRSNGYFVYGTVEGVSFQPLSVEAEPLSIVLGKDKIIQGLERGLLGLRPGARRRIVVPPTLGYVVDDLGPRPPSFGARRQISAHAKEPFLFEVSVIDVKKPA